MTNKKDRNMLEAFMEGAEAAWDLAVDNEAVRAVPVVGTAFKLLKGVDDLRSRTLMGKLHKFLNEPALRGAIEARKLREEILEDSERAHEIGETLFLVLDNVTDMTKPVLLAKAYAWYLEDKIDAFALEAVAHVIHSAFLRDLLEFLRDDFILVDGECKGRLVAAGLLYEANESWNGNRVEYRQTTLGATFLHAIKRPDVSHLD